MEIPFFSLFESSSAVGYELLSPNVLPEEDPQKTYRLFEIHKRKTFCAGTRFKLLRFIFLLIFDHLNGLFKEVSFNTVDFAFYLKIV